MNLWRRRPRVLVAVIVAALLVAGVGGWLATRGGGTVRALPRQIAVTDGPHDDEHVTLDATFYTRSDRRGRVPAILLAHGFGASKDDVREQAEDLTRHGYAVLAWSARGFGRSTGQITLDSPDYDVKDVRQLVDWLAGRPEVQLDRSGDPRVGITGQSYGGAISLLAAAYDSRIDATAPQITWYDLADALFPNAAGTGPTDGVFKKLWAGTFFAGGAASGAPFHAPRAGPGIPAARHPRDPRRGRPPATAAAYPGRVPPAAGAALSAGPRIQGPQRVHTGQWGDDRLAG